MDALIMTPRDPLVQQAAAVVVAGAVAWAAWSGFFAPSAEATRRDRTRVAALAGELAELDALVLRAGGPGPWVEEHNRRLTAMQRRLIAQEQLPALLNHLVETLKASEITLVNVTQGTLDSVLRDGQPLLADGSLCARLPVTVSATGRYHAVLAAVERLTQESFPAIVGLESVELTRQVGPTPILDATFTLSVYVTTGGASPDA